MTFSNGSINLAETQLAAEDVTCPECGGSLAIDAGAETETAIYRQAPGRMSYLETVRRPAVVVFCNGCEFALELRVQQ